MNQYIKFTLIVTALLLASPAPAQFLKRAELFRPGEGFMPFSTNSEYQLPRALVTGDFDNNGEPDLAMGVPEAASVKSEAGAVVIVYSKFSEGLRNIGIDTFTQASAAFIGNAETGDNLGRALAAGDFNGDGFDDLAISAPSEDILRSGDSIETLDAGAVYVLYGSASPVGLSHDGMQYFHQDSPGFTGAVEIGDKIGRTLAAGDFNCDGRDDLAIGAPDEDVSDGLFEATDAGAVYVLYGTSSGLSTSGMDYWHQDSSGVPGGVEAQDDFGSELAVGHFNLDDCADLAIAATGEDIKKDGALFETNDAGAVTVIYGHSSGLSSSNIQFFTQDSSGFIGAVEANDFLGDTLYAGDFDGNGVDDLAIGTPLEDVGDLANNGAVYVLYSNDSGRLSTNGMDMFYATQMGGPDLNQYDEFGRGLSSGDYNRDGYEDLAVSAPYESTRGYVYVISGSASGLTTSGYYRVSARDISPDAGLVASFGFTMASADFDINGSSDIAVGAPGASTGNVIGHGQVHVMYSKDPPEEVFADGFED